jgi:hypothetical protein
MGSLLMAIDAWIDVSRQYALAQDRNTSYRASTDTLAAGVKSITLVTHSVVAALILLTWILVAAWIGRSKGIGIKSIGYAWVPLSDSDTTYFAYNIMDQVLGDDPNLCFNLDRRDIWRLQIEFRTRHQSRSLWILVTTTTFRQSVRHWTTLPNCIRLNRSKCIHRWEPAKYHILGILSYCYTKSTIYRFDVHFI